MSHRPWYRGEGNVRRSVSSRTVCSERKIDSRGLNGMWPCPKDSVTQYVADFPSSSNSTDHHEILVLKEGE